MGYYSRSRSKRYSQWAPYVPVAERRAKAAKHASSLLKKGEKLNPVVIEGRTIGRTFWGKAWCDNLESYSDYENRLPRGRTYVRNGSVIDLQISQGKVDAKVMGSYLYEISVTFDPIDKTKWQSLIRMCTGKIDSLVELLQGKFSKNVMELIIDKNNGLFPGNKEIKMDCSCPDGAFMCKHVAAVLYGVGAMLDRNPEGLFILRHVDHTDLIAVASSGMALSDQAATHIIEEQDLSSLFGIEMDSTEVKKPPKKRNVRKKVTTQKASTATKMIKTKEKVAPPKKTPAVKKSVTPKKTATKKPAEPKKTKVPKVSVRKLKRI